MKCTSEQLMSVAVGTKSVEFQAPQWQKDLKPFLFTTDTNAMLRCSTKMWASGGFVSKQRGVRTHAHFQLI